MHSAGVVHLDIKPPNILIESATGQPRIIDLGIAIDLSGSGLVAGFSRDFSPPEQYSAGRPGGLAGKCMDGRSDLYSLGAVLYLSLTGHFPFEGVDETQWMQLRAVPEPPSKRRPELADWAGLDNLVVRLLQPDRERRTASAADAIGMIDAIDSSRAAVLGHNRVFAAILEDIRNAFQQEQYEYVVKFVEDADRRAPKLDRASILTEAREAYRLCDEARAELQAARERRERAEAYAKQLRDAITGRRWVEAVNVMEQLQGPRRLRKTNPRTEEGTEEKGGIADQIRKQSSVEFDRALGAEAKAEIAYAVRNFRKGYASPAADALRARHMGGHDVYLLKKLKEARDLCRVGKFHDARSTCRGTWWDDKDRDVDRVVSPLIEAWESSNARAKKFRWSAAALIVVFVCGVWLGSIWFQTPSLSTQSEVEEYVAEREAWHADKGSDAELRKSLDLVRRWRALYPQSKKLRDLEETVQKRIDNP